MKRLILIAIIAIVGWGFAASLEAEARGKCGPIRKLLKKC